jgi:hypothetical protein
MSSQEPVRKNVVRALVNAHRARNPIIAVAQVEASMSPTEAERAAAQEVLAPPHPNATR